MHSRAICRPISSSMRRPERMTGGGCRQHAAGVDPECLENRGQFVHEGDVQIASGVLDHLGGFRDLDRGRAVNAGGDHRAIDIRDDVERLRVLGGDDLGDGLRAMLLVAGIDALGRISDIEIRACLQATAALQDGHAILFDGAGIDRRFIDHDIASLEHSAD